MTLWATQLTLLGLIAAVFVLLLGTYRRQDAMENSFLCSVLLMGAGCVVPDALLFFPLLWWAYVLLWANNLRMYLASACGILLVALYATFIALLWPDAAVVTFVREQLTDALQRQLCFMPGQQTTVPLWWLITAAAATLLGLWMMVAHLSKYARANVRVQVRLLITIPAFLASVLSCTFPTQNGNGLFAILVAVTLYLLILYLATYGLPRIRLPRRRRDNTKRRNWKRRTNKYR